MALSVEAARVVAAIGHAVDDWKPGDHVLTHPCHFETRSWQKRLTCRPARRSWSMELLESAAR
jgi:Zn-dependent alcohol dehydrogenase